MVSAAKARTSALINTSILTFLCDLMFFLGTYHHAITDDGQGLSDHMLFGSVVSTILVVVVTAQVGCKNGMFYFCFCFDF